MIKFLLINFLLAFVGGAVGAGHGMFVLYFVLWLSITAGLGALMLRYLDGHYSTGDSNMRVRVKTRGGSGAGLAGCGCFAWLGIVLVAVLVGFVTLEYSVETWTRVAGNPVDVPFNIFTVIGGAILSEIMLPVAIVTWLLSMGGVI